MISSNSNLSNNSSEYSSASSNNSSEFSSSNDSNRISK